MEKEAIQTVRQALEICLRDYKMHLENLQKKDVNIRAYVLENKLHLGLCSYFYEVYGGFLIEDFFFFTEVLPSVFICHTPTYHKFDRQKTLESFEIRIAWIENYLKQNDNEK